VFLFRIAKLNVWLILGLWQRASDQPTDERNKDMKRLFIQIQKGRVYFVCGERATNILHLSHDLVLASALHE
jgi:hypothetical protein